MEKELPNVDDSEIIRFTVSVTYENIPARTLNSYMQSLMKMMILYIDTCMHMHIAVACN